MIEQLESAIVDCIMMFPYVLGAVISALIIKFVTLKRTPQKSSKEKKK